MPVNMYIKTMIWIYCHQQWAALCMDSGQEGVCAQTHTHLFPSFTVRGSRVCHPNVCLLGILVILSWLFLRNKRLKKSLLPLPYLLKGNQIENCLKEGSYHLNILWTVSCGTPGGRLAKSSDSPPCPTLSGWLGRICWLNVCSFLSTCELIACLPFEVQTTTSRPNPHFLLSWRWYISLNFALSSGPIFSWNPHMYIHDKLGYFLLLICVMSIWLLDQPRELQIEKSGHFPLPHNYIKRYHVNSNQCDSCYLNRKDLRLLNKSENAISLFFPLITQNSTAQNLIRCNQVEYIKTTTIVHYIAPTFLYLNWKL